MLTNCNPNKTQCCWFIPFLVSLREEGNKCDILVPISDEPPIRSTSKLAGCTHVLDLCNALYFNPVPKAQFLWYTLSDIPTVVRMQQVVLPDATLVPISNKKSFPILAATAVCLKASKIV
jgi:hypothetical protein